MPENPRRIASGALSGQGGRAPAAVTNGDSAGSFEAASIAALCAARRSSLLNIAASLIGETSFPSVIHDGCSSLSFGSATTLYFILSNHLVI